MQRQGFKSINTAGKIVSGGAFAAARKAESTASLDTQLDRIHPDKAFVLVSEEHEGSESDWSSFNTFKPSAETARRLRLLFDLPAGNATGFKIVESEFEQGDGWASDQHEHYVEVSYKGQDLLVLNGEDPMSRLRQRMAHSHRNLAQEAEQLLSSPDHERWVKLRSDRFGKPFAQTAKIREVHHHTIVTMNLLGEEVRWPLTGDDGFLLEFSRDEALKERPNLAFTEVDIAGKSSRRLSQQLHAWWIEKNPEPIMVTYTSYATEDPASVTVDAREMTLSELQTHVSSDFVTIPRNYALDYSHKLDHPPAPREMDDAARAVAEKILDNEKQLESYYRRTRPVQWRPTSDPDEIRQLFEIIWAETLQ